MAKIDLIDIQKVTRKGLKVPYPLAKSKIATEEKKKVGAYTQAEVKEMDISNLPFGYLGTPLMFRCKIGDFVLPNAPLITIKGSKTVIKTGIAGADFSIKEIISMNDYAINIVGYATNDKTDDYPVSELRKLRQLFEQNKTQFVECDLLSYFNISQIVIEDMTIPALEGYQSLIRYEINAVSDKQVELEILQNK